MDYKKLMDRIEKMSYDEYQEIRNTDEYKALNKEPSVKAEFVEVLAKRRTNDRKREKLLYALYSNPQVFEWIRDMEEYRTLRIEQAWTSIAIRGGENDAATKSSYESLDRRRRTLHNKALTSFCRLVEMTSPCCTRDNEPPKNGYYYIARDEKNGDLYDGPLMIPYEEANQYGKHEVRDAMTTGMFQLLRLIEQTHRSDWNKTRESVLARKQEIDPKKTPDITEIQADLNRTVRAYGMSDSPDRDDFSTDLFDDKDNKYKSTKRSSRYDGLDFGGE